eukprot:TRINITY_DN16395_c0_g1_i1.p1 TRINITY_DN16395_c0_g1~~TRINITY_DN16395_c0_g1_i1.p1  ORF type:complete len:428 (+),score=13.40 TRINITY_DN16395_c0_g1_i1:56-1285(+)
MRDEDIKTEEDTDLMNYKVELVSIDNYSNIEQIGNGYTTFEIESSIIIKSGEGKDQSEEKEIFTVDRRYSQFLWLHENLCSIPGLILPFFPPKQQDKMHEKVIQRRLEQLNSYLKELIKIDTIYNQWLIPFLTKSFEDIQSYISENVPAKKATILPNMTFSFFNASLPKINNEPLKDIINKLSKKYESSMDEKISFSEDSLIKAGISASDFDVNVGDYAGYIVTIARSLEDAAGILADYTGLNRSFEDDEDDIEEHEKDKKENKRFDECLNTICESFDIIGKKFNTFGNEFEMKLRNFHDLKRLSDQFKNISNDLSKSDVLISKYSTKLISEKNIEFKKKTKEFVNSLKEFKALKKKSVWFFKKIFMGSIQRLQEENSVRLREEVKDTIEKSYNNFRMLRMKLENLGGN